MNDELIQKGKDLGITQASNMKPETLIKRIQELELERESDTELSDQDKAFLKSINFELSWLGKLANQYQFTRFEYMAKFKAFRCYRDGRHVDWIDVNDLSLLNGGRSLCTILLKHSPVTPKRQVIKYNWR